MKIESGKSSQSFNHSEKPEQLALVRDNIIYISNKIGSPSVFIR